MTYLYYWGNSDRLGGPGYHPLACHGLDAAALAWTLLASDSLLSRRFPRLLGLTPEAMRPLVSFFAA